MRRRACLLFGLGAAGTCGPTPPSPAAPRLAVATADTLQLSVLRQFLKPLSDGTTFCFDPNVATFPGRPDRTAGAVWAQEVLRDVSRTAPVGVDSTAGPVPPGVATCARSRTLWREAFGIPHVAGDTGSVVTILTVIDERGGIDSLNYILQLRRRNGTWDVPGWNAYDVRVRSYVNGVGCYRFDPVATAFSPRPDTFLVRADRRRNGYNVGKQPTYRLYPTKWNVGVGIFIDQKKDPGSWHVTHDSVHFVWEGAFQRVSIDAKVLDDSLHGTITWETDAIVPDPPHAPIRGTRIACPSSR